MGKIQSPTRRTFTYSPFRPHLFSTRKKSAPPSIHPITVHHIIVHLLLPSQFITTALTVLCLTIHKVHPPRSAGVTKPDPSPLLYPSSPAPPSLKRVRTLDHHCCCFTTSANVHDTTLSVIVSFHHHTRAPHCSQTCSTQNNQQMSSRDRTVGKFIHACHLVNA